MLEGYFPSSGLNFHRRGRKDQNKTSGLPTPSQMVLRLCFLTKSGAHSAKRVFLFPFTSANSCFLQLELLKTHRKHDLITSPKEKKGEECKHDSFLSPDTSGQVDNVLKQNKSALTVTSKSSARGLQLLKAQECGCQAPAYHLSVLGRNAFFSRSGGDEES